ncbi:MAG: hypothetical protein ACR2HN_01160, partial [Tepidiformaceae bacterium]
TQRLLEAGGVVVVSARPNASRAGLVGFEGCDRYAWLPAPAGMSWGPPYLRAAEGRNLRVTAEGHPAARLLRELRTSLSYRAVFDERQPAFRGAARVLAAGGAGQPLAAEFSVLGGRVLFLPAFPDEVGTVRGEIAERLVEVVRALVGSGRDEPAPNWTRGLAVPGLEQVEAELEEATTEADAVAARLAATRERHDTLAGHRRLLWEEGPALAAAAVDAFRLLGFAVEAGEGDGLALESEGVRAFAAVEGGTGQVAEWPYIRLQRRLEEHLLREREQLKGVVVVNGRRRESPDGRPAQFSDALRIACENYRYCLLTGETLFALAQRALGGADEAALMGMRRRILSTNGLLDPTAALGEIAEGRDAGSIF